MSKGARKKLNAFINEVDEFKSIKIISKKKLNLLMADSSKKGIDFLKQTFNFTFLFNLILLQLLEFVEDLALSL